MLTKKSVEDINVTGKKVLVRCDFNVPMEDGRITDDNRIVGALPTIKYLLAHNARVIDRGPRTNRMRRTAIPQAAADSLRCVFLSANRNTHCGAVLNARKQHFCRGVRLGALSLWG